MPQTDGIWHEILKINNVKQELFMDRVLLLHRVALKKRAGKASNVRLSLAKWDAETNIMAALGHVLQEMGNQPSMFSPEHLKAARAKVLEGDYHDDMQAHIDGSHFNWSPSHTQLWSDHLAPTNDAAVMDAAAARLNSMADDASRIAFEQDQLKLATDIANIGRMLDAYNKSDRARHLAKFMAKSTVDEAPCVLLLDFTKNGRLSAKDLDRDIGMVKKFLSAKPLMTMAVVVAPFLESARLGQRAELRRIEDKADAKMLYSQSITFRMESPPSNKSVPIIFPAWVMMDANEPEKNFFWRCSLLVDRGNRSNIPFEPERNYIIPVAIKDSVPSASEGSRAMSDVQEAAQILCGAAFPEAILAGCFANMPSRTMFRTVHLSPYDAHWEKTVAKYHLEEQRPRICSLSLTNDMDIAQYCEQILALDILQAWKQNASTQLLAEETGFRRYESEVSGMPASPDPRDYGFKLVEVTADDSQRGVGRYRFSLSPTVRAQYNADVVHRMQWQGLMEAFDKQFARHMQTQAADAPGPISTRNPEVADGSLAWDGEPSTLDDLTGRYEIEHKIPARTAGASLFICKSTERDGQQTDVCDAQKFKVFLAAR
ncbi:unnamed protein product [Symbiodinium sp. CCMP2592]|nr:unnamed protein product [Symbiodinium sp. CCMP2592]